MHIYTWEAKSPQPVTTTETPGSAEVTKLFNIDPHMEIHWVAIMIFDCNVPRVLLYDSECWKNYVASNRHSNFPNQMSTTYPQDLLAKRHLKWYHDIQYFAHFSWILSVKPLAPKIVISTAQQALWWKWLFPYLPFRIPQPTCSNIVYITTI